MTSYSKNAGKILVNAFFFSQDQGLRKAFRDRLQEKERRDQLAQVSGIRDDALLDRLIELGIGPETLAAIAIVPLVFVAWADGRVQPEERETIVAIAKSAGVQPLDGGYPLLERWLKRCPNADTIDAWENYVKDLCQRLNRAESERLHREVLDRASNRLRRPRAAFSDSARSPKRSASRWTSWSRLS